MKLKLVMKDIEYERALIKSLYAYNQDLFIESGEFKNTDEDNLIVTDYNPRKFNLNIVKDHRGGIVFMSKRKIPERLKNREVGPFFIFKYSGVENIMASLNLAYSLWMGDINPRVKKYETISVFSDYDDKRTGYISEILSRHIIYRKGFKAIIIPLTFTNNHVSSYKEDRREFLRIMYYIERERLLSRETFFRKDTYDVEYLRIPPGINYIASLEIDKLNKIIDFLGKNYFDFIILDIGNAYTELGMSAIEKSKYGVWVHSGESEEVYSEIRRVKGSDIFKVNWESGLDRVELMSEDIVMQIFDSDNKTINKAYD